MWFDEKVSRKDYKALDKLKTNRRFGDQSPTENGVKIYPEVFGITTDGTEDGWRQLHFWHNLEEPKRIMIELMGLAEKGELHWSDGPGSRISLNIMEAITLEEARALGKWLCQHAEVAENRIPKPSAPHNVPARPTLAQRIGQYFLPGPP